MRLFNFKQIKLLKFLMILLVSSMAVACAPKVEMRGNLPSPSKLESLAIGIDDMNQVVGKLGTPSLVATFDSFVWYYISTRREGYGFYKKDVIEHLVLELHFNQDKVLSEIKKYTKDDLKDIDYLTIETPTSGREFTFWEQIFGNLGARPTNSSSK